MNICRDLVALIQARLGEVLELRDRVSKKEDDSYVSQGDLLVQSIVFAYIHENIRYNNEVEM